MSKSKKKEIDYRQEIRSRFLEAIRTIIKDRAHGIKTVAELAPKIGAFQQNISLMEKGDRYPTLEQVAKLCETFEFSTEWIMLGKGQLQLNGQKSSENEDRFIRIEKALNELLKASK
ncbi:hypothetical protein ABDK00_014270 [Niabella insulamsoli]|uniref:hypothetical protein n=1 Tax=Niabella insulamsoli TaxID=3144874 RepID=UPI0031FE2656